MISELKLESKKATDALRWVIDILNKHHIIYQVTGGLAAKIYGAKRALADIDLDLPDLAIRTILPEVKPYILYFFNFSHSLLNCSYIHYNNFILLHCFCYLSISFN
jgi:hypothetical protein